MADIGEPLKRIEFVPMPDDIPVPEHVPASPVPEQAPPVPEREPVGAPA